jgi:hypothetical protein
VLRASVSAVCHGAGRVHLDLPRSRTLSMRRSDFGICKEVILRRIAGPSGLSA